MSLFDLPTGQPVVRISVYAVTFYAELPDERATAIVRRVVPAGLRQPRPHRGFVIARSRQRQLVDALTEAGYRVDVIGVNQ